MPEFKPALSDNYTAANRPSDVSIHYIVIHATELSYADTIARFQSPHHVSAHMVVRGADGQRTAMVTPDNVAWHAGNWDMNCRSLGIEQEAYVADAASFTAPMLAALADQILTWSVQYHIPLDRAHLLGHDNVAAPSREAAKQMHRDPGWQFDWAQLFRLLGVSSEPSAPVKVGQALKITSQYVDLVQQPDVTGEVIGQKTDPLSYRASYGQEFVCVAKQGEWIAIDFGGQQAWFNQRDATGVIRSIYTVDQTSIPLYGSTQPNAATIAELQIGEQYVISDTLKGLQTSDTDGYLSAKATSELYAQIWYNHRIGYIKAAQK
ncbi:N-acetylmuramoyl-L-alanine amidase [Secundilactobacillus hailunensis]|uniref:N-acetylmuramoyl-L-alanine amidase n=1 Tax=Secundilactobacillus hailunensis TaxID=2559923 RepID=A0ABW1T8E4_9LACO|nr:peptidoglycan recognition family protein [Secundilactobacillus hailunensis]